MQKHKAAREKREANGKLSMKDAKPMRFLNEKN